MTKEPTIIVDVLPDGSAKVQVVGVTGSACKAFSKPIEDALGIVSSDTPTPEYYQQSQLQSQQRLKGRT